MAVIYHGHLRATEDIDLLIERSAENQEKVFRALAELPDNAVSEIETGDFESYTVIRVADEIVVDLMLEACGVSCDEASSHIETKVINGVAIPFANPELMIRLKQTVREKDSWDRNYLEDMIRRRANGKRM